MRHVDHVSITVADLDTEIAFFVALGLEVEDVQAAVDAAAAASYGLVGGIGEYEGVWRMAYVRGPEGSSARWPHASVAAANPRRFAAVPGPAYGVPA